MIEKKVANAVAKALEKRFGIKAAVWGKAKSKEQGFLYGCAPCVQVVLEGAYDWPQSFSWRVNRGEFGPGAFAEPANGFILNFHPA